MKPIPPSKITRATLHVHARRRAFSRYGVRLNKDLRRRIIAAIQASGTQLVVDRSSINFGTFDVPIDGITFRVVYDRRRKAIATFLPPPPPAQPQPGTTEESHSSQEGCTQ